AAVGARRAYGRHAVPHRRRLLLARSRWLAGRALVRDDVAFSHRRAAAADQPCFGSRGRSIRTVAAAPGRSVGGEGLNGQRAGALVLVATPIGNLGDLAPRAVEELRVADLIACEDTRRTRKLLTHAGVGGAGRLVAVHDHNEA